MAALVVVDFQEDFCPPHGSLAVPSGRDIAPHVNALLSLPFAVKIATRDWHPSDHVSFAANHSAEPFTSFTTITHRSDPSRSFTTRLWPVHCLQGTHGAQLVPELDASKIDVVIDKGRDPALEMYSAFRDPFGGSDTGLAARLRESAVTDVFVVGLAADYCVKATAEHAVEEGFNCFVVQEATRPVSADDWPDCRRELLDKGVKLVSVHGEEVARVKG